MKRVKRHGVARRIGVPWHAGKYVAATAHMYPHIAAQLGL